MRWPYLFVLAASMIQAQPVRVYSEFAKINDAGDVTAPESPREILSPAVARNGYASFQVIVQVPAGTKFSLYVGQNPADAAKVTMYHRKEGELEAIVLPYDGQSTQVFWMDLHIAETSPVRRIKIEPQVLIHDDWVIYPMEVRVMGATVPEHAPEADAHDDPFGVAQRELCGASKIITKKTAAQPTYEYRLRERNAWQDAALVRQFDSAGREALIRLMGRCGVAAPADPEFYLRVRDAVLRLASSRTRESPLH